jgi:type II secretory pathway component PulM
MTNTNSMESGIYETNRRTALLSQANRIREYLPTLKARMTTVEQELSELRTLIADEEATAEDLSGDRQILEAQVYVLSLAHCRIALSKTDLKARRSG